MAGRLCEGGAQPARRHCVGLLRPGEEQLGDPAKSRTAHTVAGLLRRGRRVDAEGRSLAAEHRREGWVALHDLGWAGSVAQREVASAEDLVLHGR